MSGFFGIIFYVVIFIIFISAKNAAQSGNNHRRGTTALPNISKKSDRILPNVPKENKKTLPNVPENGKTVIPNVPMKRKFERNFMEPHKEESLQPKIRNNNLWGEDAYANQRIVALRLMEGDPVPEGYIKIKCPYCAADNIVTKHCKQYHSCYFCRVPID